MAHEVFVQKNVYMDKSPETALIFECIIGHSVFLSQSDQIWRAKRKALAHAFYREKLTHMNESLEKIILKKMARWSKEIEAKGWIEIYETIELRNIFSRHIIYVSFGEDISEELVWYNTKESGKWENVEMTWAESIYLLFHQITDRYLSCIGSPINWLYAHTNKLIAMNADSKMVQ